MTTALVFLNLLSIVMLILSAIGLRYSIRSMVELHKKFGGEEAAKKLKPIEFYRIQRAGRSGCLTFIISALWLIAWVCTHGWRLTP